MAGDAGRPPEPAAEPSDSDPVLRSVDLGDGRVLVVRLATDADVPGLEAVYERLSDADRRLRFFSLHHPPRAFFEAAVRVGERGGCALVAEVRGPDGDREVVGEAWCAAPEGGEAELAIVVDRAWRGGLGRLLLDALVEAAAARGIRDLVAVVLPDNGGMLRLVHTRPHVVLDDGDPSTVCVAIGATDATPGWPEPRTDGRRRVLVESARGRWPAAAAAEHAGFDVRVCPGPPADDPRRCPAQRGEPCPLVTGADVVVVAPRRSADEVTDLLDAHRALHGGVPVVVEVPPGSGADPRWAGPAVPATMAVDDLVHVVDGLAACHGSASG